MKCFCGEGRLALLCVLASRRVVRARDGHHCNWLWGLCSRMQDIRARIRVSAADDGLAKVWNLLDPHC